jgi:hypothetical protein
MGYQTGHRKNGRALIVSIILVISLVTAGFYFSGLSLCAISGCANQWVTIERSTATQTGTWNPYFVGNGLYGFTIPGSLPISTTGFLQVAKIESYAEGCGIATGGQLAGQCAAAVASLGGAYNNLPATDRCNPATAGSSASLALCELNLAGSPTSYGVDANLLPAKLLGQDNNFTQTFGDQCSVSASAACSSSSACPSSAPTGCSTLIRSFTSQGKVTTVTDFIYTFGVDLRIGFVGQQPVVAVGCTGAGVTGSYWPPSISLTHGSCAGQIVSELNGPLGYLNANDKATGQITLDVSAPYFAYSSPYDYYGLWNAYLAQKGCTGIGSSNIVPCNLGGHASLSAAGNGAQFKDPSQWTTSDFVNLVQTLPQKAQITFKLNGIGPVYSANAINPNGSDASCQSDLNSAASTASTCQLTIGGAQLVEIPIIFQELAQATVTSTPINNGCLAGNYTVSGCKTSNTTVVPPPGGNIGNVTKHFQNYTSPYETFIVRVSDTSGFWHPLIPLGGLVVTLEPLGQQLMTNASGYVVFTGVPPPVGNSQYSVYAVDPGGFSILFVSVPADHVTPSATVTIPSEGGGTYLINLVMVTSYAGFLTIVASIFLILIIAAVAVILLRGAKAGSKTTLIGRILR